MDKVITVNVVIFSGGKFRKNVDTIVHLGGNFQDVNPEWKS